MISGKKKDTEIYFSKAISSLSRKINLIYLLWKSKLLKSILSSKEYFTKLCTDRKINNKLFQGAVVTKSCFPEFSFISKLPSGKNFTCNISQWKYFTNFLQFLVSQRLSHTKLLEKVFVIYLIAIRYVIKEKLIFFPTYISQWMVYWLKWFNFGPFIPFHQYLS